MSEIGEINQTIFELDVHIMMFVGISIYIIYRNDETWFCIFQEVR